MSPDASQMTTPWTDRVDRDLPHPEYPRPKLIRERWLNLNGKWEYAIRPFGQKMGDADGQILVPFPVESYLSGVQRPLQPSEALWYRKSFTVPEAWHGERLLLHFGAVDWRCRVWIGDKMVGGHSGGYTPFSLDVTKFVNQGENELTIRVIDPSDEGDQPHGKQRLYPSKIWYTPSSGIWQTVWLEPVSALSIEGVMTVPNADASAVTFEIDLSGEIAEDSVVRVVVEGKELDYGDDGFVFAPDAPRRWSPHDPHIYRAKILLEQAGEVIDEVETSFGLRSFDVRQIDSTPRLCLNGEPIFVRAPLDQGFWPDGLYTPPTEEAMLFDLKQTKVMGFNAVRKHVKVESQRWYEACDRLGLMVIQDMPNAPGHVHHDGEEHAQAQHSDPSGFVSELTELIDCLSPHPSVVAWVPFNEGWGQFSSLEVAEHVKDLDPSRVVIANSGWLDTGGGDVIDVHAYPGPKAPEHDGRRATLLGEFGGLGWPVEGHLWQESDNWGYRTYATREEFRERFAELWKATDALAREKGLSGVVYTQTTDVEGEVNGLITYDRRVVKLEPGDVRKAVAGCGD